MNGTHTYPLPNKTKGQAWAQQLEHSLSIHKALGSILGSLCTRHGFHGKSSSPHYVWKAVTAGPHMDCRLLQTQELFLCGHLLAFLQCLRNSGRRNAHLHTLPCGRQVLLQVPTPVCLCLLYDQVQLRKCLNVLHRSLRVQDCAAEGRVTSHLSLALDLWSLPLRAMLALCQAPLCSPVEEAGCVFADPFHLLSSGPPSPPPGLIKAFS